MIYAMSDIHGQYELFRNLMEQITLGKDDILYVLGDVVDRGPDSMKTLKYMMATPNIIPIMGNHELMALPCLKLLVPELSNGFLHKLSSQARQSFAEWTLNGEISTIQEFLKLPQEERRQVVEYIESFTQGWNIFRNQGGLRSIPWRNLCGKEPILTSHISKTLLW